MDRVGPHLSLLSSMSRTSSGSRLTARQVSLASLGAVLVAALAFVVVGTTLHPKQAFRGTLKDLLPRLST